ncbi:hypothetical protein EDB19DRAFT_1749181 [Suillus lakei]|nr:hypothetical protein EDB19DRAFT_1749181 [Suillus lakei]
MGFWILILFALFQQAENRTSKIGGKVHENGDDGKEGYPNTSAILRWRGCGEVWRCKAILPSLSTYAIDVRSITT